MSEKKRKRQHEGADAASTKGPQIKDRNATIKVTVVNNDGILDPIVADSSGFKLPSSLVFTPYQRSQGSKVDLHLHSETHPTIDYTASNESQTSTEGFMKHYIGVYDPDKSSLSLLPCKRMTVRSSLKSARGDPNESSVKEEEQEINYLLKRQDLALEFGSKNSKKAVKERTANVIAAASGDAAAGGKLDEVAKTILADMPVASNASNVSLDRTKPDAGRPCPTPNLDATTPGDVYALNELVGSEEVLHKMRIIDWTQAVEKQQNLQMRMAFTAHRMPSIVLGKNMRLVRALRYLDMLLHWNRLLKPWTKSGRKSPLMSDQSMTMLKNQFGQEAVEKYVFKRFTDPSNPGVMNRWRLDFFLTHVLALTLTLDGFHVDVYDITHDLGMKVEDVAKLYKALGCKVEVPGKVDRASKGIHTLAEAQMHKTARLQLPLVFPKGRRMVQK